jgi:hypothetical protein
LNELGELLVTTGRTTGARPYLEEALARATASGDRYEQGRAHLGLARVHADDGDQAGSARAAARAAALFGELGIPRAAWPHLAAEPVTGTARAGRPAR